MRSSASARAASRAASGGTNAAGRVAATLPASRDEGLEQRHARRAGAIGEQQAARRFRRTRRRCRHFSSCQGDAGSRRPNQRSGLPSRACRPGGERAGADRAHGLQRHDALDVGIGLRRVPLDRRARLDGGLPPASAARGRLPIDAFWMSSGGSYGASSSATSRSRAGGFSGIAAEARGFDASVGSSARAAARGRRCRRVAERLANAAPDPPLLQPVVDEHADDEHDAGGDEAQLQRGHAISE